MTRSRVILPGAVVVVVLTVGVSLALALGPAAPPPSAPIAFVPTTAGSSPAVAPTAALATAVAAVGSTAVASASIGAPPAGPSQQNRPGMPWLYETVRVPSLENGEQILPLWQADLIEGATVERSGTSADVYDDFGGATFNAVLPDGTTVPNVAAGLGDIARGQKFSDAGESDAQIAAATRASLQSFALSTVSIKVFHPAGDAVSVIATTSDPTKTVGQFGTVLDTLFGKPPRYEGYYLEIRDAAGNGVVRTSASFLTGAGRLWVAPEYESNVVGITHG